MHLTVSSNYLATVADLRHDYWQVERLVAGLDSNAVQGNWFLGRITEVFQDLTVEYGTGESTPQSTKIDNLPICKVAVINSAENDA